MLLREVYLTHKDDYNTMWIWTKIYLSLSPTTQFNILSKVGIFIISALSGFSVVNTPFFFFQYYDPTITNIKKGRIEDDLRAVWEDVIREKLELTKIYHPANAEAVLKESKEDAKKTYGFLSTFFGKKHTKYEKSIHNTERTIKLSQKLMSSLFLDHVEICREEEKLVMSKERRWYYFAQKILAICLVVYGVYKIIMTLIVLLIMGRNKPIDPVSNFFRFTLRNIR